MKTNWKTTAAGVCGSAAAILLAAKAVLSGEHVDWTAVIAAATALASGVGLLFAKDAAAK